MYVPRTKAGIQKIPVKGLVYMELTRLRLVIDGMIRRRPGNRPKIKLLHVPGLEITLAICVITRKRFLRWNELTLATHLGR